MGTRGVLRPSHSSCRSYYQLGRMGPNHAWAVITLRERWSFHCRISSSARRFSLHSRFWIGRVYSAWIDKYRSRCLNLLWADTILIVDLFLSGKHRLHLMSKKMTEQTRRQKQVWLKWKSTSTDSLNILRTPIASLNIWCFAECSWSHQANNLVQHGSEPPRLFPQLE